MSAPRYCAARTKARCFIKWRSSVKGALAFWQKFERSDCRSALGAAAQPVSRGFPSHSIRMATADLVVVLATVRTDRLHRGSVVVAIFNRQDHWRFRQRGGEVRCRKRCLLFWRTRRWLLHEVKRVVVHQHTDKHGDTFSNVRLELRSGDWVPMSAASHQMDTAGELQEIVDRLNRFLGPEPQPLQVQDDHPPPPDPAEIERQLEQLVTTHPRLARILGKIAHWTRRKRPGLDSLFRGADPRAKRRSSAGNPSRDCRTPGWPVPGGAAQLTPRRKPSSAGR